MLIKIYFLQFDSYSTLEVVKNTANQHKTEVSIQTKMQTYENDIFSKRIFYLCLATQSYFA